MKTILFLRHAKSTWDDPDWTDLTRPLNSKGLKDASMIADIIFDNYKLAPDVIYSSPALRALMTANIFAKKINYPENKIVIDEDIYKNGTKHIKNLLQKQNEDIRTVMFFGHNPDITSLASYFSGYRFEHVPTCGAVCVDFDQCLWQDILKFNGVTRFFEYPGKYA